ncbi:GntR family transcriptional regulator [Bordetella sp. 15P40C-2]|nr:GntR family transcriptional regulator [Bordetella sp. 15P40C-2]MVW80755.1 GntR family transcriptional regulator [Bordetella sp. 02P26C-1]
MRTSAGAARHDCRGHPKQDRGRGVAVGQKLPAEAQIAAEFGVSRSAVREAISRLKSDGLIETRKGWGLTSRRRPR